MPFNPLCERFFPFPLLSFFFFSLLRLISSWEFSDDVITLVGRMGAAARGLGAVAICRSLGRLQRAAGGAAPALRGLRCNQRWRQGRGENTADYSFFCSPRFAFLFLLPPNPARPSTDM